MMFSTASEINDEMLKLFGTIESVEEGCERFYSELEQSARSDRYHLNPDTFNSPSLTKKTLARYLHCLNNIVNTKSSIMNQLREFVTKLVSENNQYREETSRLMSSTIQAQESVISLQSELLQCKDDKLLSVQSTVHDAVEKSVKSEMKSYSAAVGAAQKSPTPALGSLKQVVKQVVQAEDRSRNVVVFGLVEGEAKDTCQQIDELFEYLGEKPRHESVRIGIQRTPATTPRPVKVTVANSSHVFQLLRAARKLKDCAKYHNVFICPDRTSEERKNRRAAVASLKQKMKDEPEKRHFIRDGKVVTTAT